MAILVDFSTETKQFTYTGAAIARFLRRRWFEDDGDHL